MKQQATLAFAKQFGQEPALVSFSPGRINVIGEHTDYNEGFVLPAAIHLGVTLAIGPSPDGHIHLHAADFDASMSIDATHIAPVAEGWPNYVLGMVDQLRLAGHEVPAFCASISSNLPTGAGLSSSAALECAAGFALDQWLGLGCTKTALVKMAQGAEHKYAGVHCGIMDMFASVMGLPNQVVRLDCRDLSFAYFPLETPGYSWLLLNTNVKHNLAETAYNQRRLECQQAVAAVNQYFPDEEAHESLRTITPELLEAAPMAALVRQRASFVVAENQRVIDACMALNAGDVATLGQLLFASHEGLSKQYEVSCAELDFLVDACRNHRAVLGARMMGGGFGGCTINLVKTAELDALVAHLQPIYEQQFSLGLTPLQVQVGPGTHLL